MKTAEEVARENSSGFRSVPRGRKAAPPIRYTGSLWNFVGTAAAAIGLVVAAVSVGTIAGFLVNGG